MIGPFFYDVRQSVDDVSTYSPSAAKPAKFMELIAHHYRPVPELPVTPVSREDLYLVHDKSYVDGVFSGTILNGFENNDPRVPEACLWTVGSMVCAAQYAPSDALPVCSPTSGFHHAGYAWGGGFCTFNGLMVAAAKFIQAHPGAKVGILDCDAHYGDGTADILKCKPELTKSVIHHSGGKFFHEPQDADEYFLWLQQSIDDINQAKCDVVLYQAGADLSVHDPLGGVLDNNQMYQRDRMVFRKVRAPIVWNLAGGYQDGLDDIHSSPVLDLHRRTAGEANSSSDLRLKFFETRNV